MRPPPGTRLVLLRHGESVGGKLNVVQGCRDYLLSEIGESQAREAASVIRQWPVSLVVSSNLTRARDTAMLSAGRIDAVDERFCERDAGPWTGLSKAVRDLYYTDGESRHLDGYETVASVRDRMLGACTELSWNLGLVLVFTHNAAMRVLESHLGDARGHFENLEGLCLGEDLSVLQRIGPVRGYT